VLLDEGFRVSVVTFQHSSRFPVDVLQLEGANISEFEMPVLLHIPNECFPNGLAYALDNARCDALAAGALGDVVVGTCAPAFALACFVSPLVRVRLRATSTTAIALRFCSRAAEVTMRTWALR
jgi:hypothetical protein